MTTRTTTIIAISSGAGRAGVAVMRASGPKASALFAYFGVSCPVARRASVRRLRLADGSILDEAMTLWLPGPGTATGEDMAEFHLHGSPAIVEAAIRHMLACDGVVLAEAGAFTRRAFENGRLDLVQVEGLADVLHSDSEAQRRLAMRQFLGDASHVFEGWRTQVLQALALLEAAIDFVDEADVAERAWRSAQPVLHQVVSNLSDALGRASRTAAIRKGLRVVIAGPPNVGKSSLLNLLVEREAAIVSPIAGTTRDVVEAAMVLDGTPVLLADTAGLRDAVDDVIEREGVRRSLARMDEADVLVWVVDPATVGRAPPERVADIRVLNKTDMLGAAELIRFRNDGLVPVSVQDGTGVDVLRQRLSDEIRSRNDITESDVVVRERHRVAIHHALVLLQQALGRDHESLELAAEDVRKAAQELSFITGRIGVEDVLGKIFQDFCIGK